MRSLKIAIMSATLLAGATVATAVDRPIAGAELRIRRGANDTERLVFSSHDSLLLPAPGSADDPVTGSPGGATIELFSAGDVATFSFSAPKDTSDRGWRAGVGRYLYGHNGAPDGVSAVSSIRMTANGGIRIIAKRAGLALDHEGRVGLRITTGGIRHCALFGPATVKRDEPNSFRAAKAPASALADCSDASLAAPATPTPSPTPPAGQCGNGVIDPTEACDGAALGYCEEAAGASCGQPGFSNACQCCSNSAPIVLYGCCNPSSVAVSYGPAGGGDCFALRCDAPFTCGTGAECLPSGDCCALPDTVCNFTLTGQDLQPCCAGSECSRPDASGFFLTCCVSQGSACSTDQECCSGSCSESGSCD